MPGANEREYAGNLRDRSESLLHYSSPEPISGLTLWNQFMPLAVLQSTTFWAITRLYLMQGDWCISGYCKGLCVGCLDDASCQQEVATTGQYCDLASNCAAPQANGYVGCIRVRP